MNRTWIISNHRNQLCEKFWIRWRKPGPIRKERRAAGYSRPEHSEIIRRFWLEMMPFI